jgi:hypothetical protein
MNQLDSNVSSSRQGATDEPSLAHAHPSAFPVPRRHGPDINKARREATPLLWGHPKRASADPDPVEWHQLGCTLLEGDPLADDVAAWIRAQPRSEGWRRLEQGLAGGADAVADVPVLHRYFELANALPPWLDRASLERGLDASARFGLMGMRVLRDLGLMAGYRASAINQTLVRTGALEASAQKRVAETTRWWMACMEPGGLRPGGAGVRATLKVRVIHALVRATILDSGTWDREELGVPVNQLDMQATYLAFSVLFLFGQRFVGVPVAARDAQDVMHLWRYIGWLMGVKESLLVESESDGRLALYRNLLSQPAADRTSQQLGRALMDEPLDRNYPNFKKFRGWWNKHVHLSIVRFFIGSTGMRELGLPAWVMPWYPMLWGPPHFVVRSLLSVVPAAQRWMVVHGRRRQKALMVTLEHPTAR